MDVCVLQRPRGAIAQFKLTPERAEVDLEAFAAASPWGCKGRSDSGEKALLEAFLGGSPYRRLLRGDPR